MKARLLAAAMLAFVTGCALLIDLGDEAKLAPTADAAIVVDSAITPPVQTPDTGATPICGLPDSTSTTCSSCIHTSCCEITKACANTPECVVGLECVKECLVQSSCIIKCISDHPAVKETTDCSAFQCPVCTPRTECAKLGACVFYLPTDALIRKVEEGRILELDEEQCKTARQQVAGVSADAGACF